MNLDRKIELFCALSEIIEKHISGKQTNHNLASAISKAEIINPWFTQKNINSSLSEISKCLKKENLVNWLSKYKFSNKRQKTVAVIMAGNIPLVGFHDFLSVILSGHKVKIKLSSKDSLLLEAIIEIIKDIDNEISKLIDCTEGQINDYDAVIATGSNNTSRYFDYYFGKYPHIFRKNRNSVGIIQGNETHSELKLLAKDIFMYFGLGCRSVSKLFIPKNYDLQNIFKSFDEYSDYINHNKYMNNYNYYKTIYLTNGERFLDNGWCILKQEESFSSPISVIYYQEYESTNELDSLISFNIDKLQCISKLNPNNHEVKFGQTQSPGLNDYADGIDIMQFLLEEI